MRTFMPFGAALAASLGLAFLGAGSAQAANPIQKECAQKYQAAKAANTLNGMKYNEYYKQCAAAAKAAPAAPAAATPTVAPAPAPAPVAPTPTVAPAPRSAPAAPTTTAARPAAPVATGATVFPTALSPQFSTESAGKQRMHTCLAQYNANKATNGNGGLKWIMKGGGYYSECNKRLKG